MEDPIAQAGCIIQSSRILMEGAQRISLSWHSAPMGRLSQSQCVQGWMKGKGFLWLAHDITGSPGLAIKYINIIIVINRTLANS